VSFSLERRLRNLEQRFGFGPKLEVPMVFIDSPRYKDEPDDLITGAKMDELTWNRQEGEDLKAFQERVGNDVRKVERRGFLALTRDHTGLPEPSVSMPAYTPYAEVLKRMNNNKSEHQERT